MPKWHFLVEQICQIIYGVYMESESKLLKIRQTYGLTQKQAASVLGVPLRTFIRYETSENYGSPMKRFAMVESLKREFEVNESKGLLDVDVIHDKLNKLFGGKYMGQIDFCYLFGSYAKGYATESSDVDLCICTPLSGLKFVGLSESIREELCKKVDLISFASLSKNPELLREIMKDGIKIYG